MRMKKILKYFLLFIAIIVISLFIYNSILSIKYKNPVSDDYLSKGELNELDFISELKSKIGSQLWLGYDTINIPIILFNDKCELRVEN
jgi:hypothetical protein